MLLDRLTQSDPIFLSPKYKKKEGKKVMKRIVSLVVILLVIAALVLGIVFGRENSGKVDPDKYLANVPAVEDLTGTDTSKIIGLEDGVLTVGMECAYAPYNWTQTDDSNGAVPIANVPGSYANGYDVMIAKRI